MKKKKKNKVNSEVKFRKGDIVEYVDDSTQLRKVGEIKKVLKNGKYQLKGLIGEFSDIRYLTEHGVSWMLFQQSVKEYVKLVNNMNTFFRHRGLSPFNL